MLNQLKKFARVEGDSEEIAFRKYLILIIATTCCFFGLVWGCLYCFVFGFGLTAFLPFLFVVIVGSSILISHLLRNYKILIHVQLFSITTISMLIQWSIGSLDQSGFVTTWSFLGPLGALIFLSMRQAIFWMLYFLFIIVVSVLFNPVLHENSVFVSQETRNLFYIMNIGIASSVVFATLAWFASRIQYEKRRSDNLLLNILPGNVAEELKAKGTVEPREYENATVLFTDFIRFTEISQNLSAKDLVEEINFCFAAFDEITSRHNIEKIKTIGDAYMAFDPGSGEGNHSPVSVVMAGLEMQKFLSERKKFLESQGRMGFEMRLGIHSGYVVAGVVGVKKFQYDIWGDTVNTASRMESSGEAGRVNISASTFDLVKEVFKCEHRGKLPVKGKNLMDMYFVETPIK